MGAGWRFLAVRRYARRARLSRYPRNASRRGVPDGATINSWSRATVTPAPAYCGELVAATVRGLQSAGVAACKSKAK